MSELTIEEKISQLFIVGYFGLKPDLQLMKWLKSSLGGIVLFRENIKSPEQIFQQNIEFYNSSKVLPFIAIDQEGGKVERIKGAAQIPTAMALAYTEDVESVDFAISLLARQIELLGFNLNFAPVLDVNTNPDNPIVGIRSFGESSDTVSKYSQIAINAIKKCGIIPVVKHFPGHGATDVDSHLELPVINLGIDELEKVHLAPFKSALQNGIEMVMSSHIYFKHLAESQELPATLSYNVIKGLLREKLNFGGLVISDDMDMQAIAFNYSIKEAVRLAITAGNDLLIYRDYKHAMKAHKALLKMLKDNIIPLESVEQSVRKILLLKQSIKQIDSQKSFPASQFSLTDKETSQLKDLYSKTLNIVKPPKSTLKRDEIHSVLIISVDKTVLNHYRNEQTYNFDKYFDNVYELRIPLNPTYEQVEYIQRASKEHEAVIFISYDSKFSDQQQSLIKTISQYNKLYLLIAGSPYDSHLYPDTEMIVVSYGYSNQSVEAFMNILMG